MKRALLFLLGAALAFVVTSLWFSQRQARLAARDAGQRAALQEAWDSEKAELESALEKARAQARVTSNPNRSPTAPEPDPRARLSPAEILAFYQALRILPGSNPAPVLRRASYLLEELAQAGPAALPAIREFLARYQDADLDSSYFQSGRSGRDRIPMEFSLPPSLRFGLFEVTRRIGGAEAETILAESLARTGRGAEVAYLALALDDISPNTHREQALTVARALLRRPTPQSLSSPLDRNHREYLFALLTWFNDSSYASEAQAQLVRPDSQVDRGALRYIQQTLGARAVPIIEQAYQNPLLTNSAGKEPLARMALSFVGTDAQANEFYQKTINDPLLTRSHRKNLIEDLNQDGFADTRNLTAADLPIIQNRITLIEALAPGAMDDANAAAFQEAHKDLLDMRAKLLNPPAGTPAPTTPVVPR